jgi:4-alpha-glucanotransferase
MDDKLNRLADLVGIEARYWDIEGGLHETGPDTARALLGALGFRADSDAAVSESLARLEAEEWRETLPPVIIAREGRDISVPLRLPAAGGDHLHWRIYLESGEIAEGTGRLGDLAVEGTGSRDGTDHVLRRLGLPAQPCGYHRIEIQADIVHAADVIVAPSRCHLPPEGRYWGISTQLYALRSERNWGIGDFTDLTTLMDWAGAKGAAAVGVNPLHALFLDRPGDASPYSPNSRLFLNPLYLDVTAIPDFAESEKGRAGALSGMLGSAWPGDIIDYPAVAGAKLAVLESLYRHFRSAHGEKRDSRGHAFRQFVAQGGDTLRRFAAFQAASEQFGTHDWTQWPQWAQQPDSTRHLSEKNAERIAFFQYLQWQSDIQLTAAVASGRAKGMAIGLYKDLAISADRASADHWAHQDLFMRDVKVGAPPDPFNEQGQDWGLIAFNPHCLRAQRYRYFASLLRAVMHYAGALRVDHVMGWQRLFVIPGGARAAEGAYLRFPREDLIAIAALESRRNRCMVIGEDLGTVPAGFRERMAEAGILSCRILYFEREGGRYHRPGQLPQLAAVADATHDLPTLRGYWSGEDISAKLGLGILDPGREKDFRDEREEDKRQLLQALESEGLYESAQGADWSPALASAIQAFLARTPSLLFLAQLEDLTGELHQANLPGSVNGYPNWRRRLRLSLAEIASDPATAESLAVIVRERPSASGPAD